MLYYINSILNESGLWCKKSVKNNTFQNGLYSVVNRSQLFELVWKWLLFGRLLLKDWATFYKNWAAFDKNWAAFDKNWATFDNNWATFDNNWAFLCQYMVTLFPIYFSTF